MRANPSFIGRVVSFLSSPWPAAAVVTLVTLGAVGAVVAISTPAGCSIGVGNSNRCRQAAQVNPTYTPGAKPGYVYSPPPVFQAPPNNQPASAPYYPNGPDYPPTSQPYPPGNLHNPNLPPYEFDTGASGAYPVGTVVASGSDYVDVGLRCRLPVYAGGAGSGGFLVLPDHTFVVDPRSAVTLPPPSGTSSPLSNPYGGQAQYGLSYDFALGKWLPVQPQWVSPDGKHYAYADYASGIYVIDASTNAQVELGEGKRWQLFTVTNTSVFAEELQQAGLVEMSFAGATRQVTTTGYWQAVGGGAAYGTATSAVPQGVATTILRLDLATGKSQPWFQLDGAQPTVAGFDGAGHPLMWVNVYGYGPYMTYVWVVNGLGDATVLASGQFNGSIITDSHGIWISGNQQIILVKPGVGVFVVANIGGQIGGECA
jgi:hypothetical protein